MAIDPDIFIEARKRVDNKGVAARVGHSSAFHMFRSAAASRGSAGSKALKVGTSLGASALKLIPVPIVGDLAGAAVRRLEGWARSKHHKKRLSGATSETDVVKFQLKEVSVENLDRYRWKVSESLKAANDAVAAFPTGPCTCHDLFNVAQTVAQAERRIDKLKSEMLKILGVCSITLDWLAVCEAGQQNANSTPTTHAGHGSNIPTEGLIHLKNQINTLVSQRQQRWSALPQADKDQSLVAHKANCTDWCQFQDPNEVSGMNADLARARNWAAAVAQTVTSPYTYESFITVKGSDYEFKEGD